MPFGFWTQLIKPGDILPARYLRRPDAPPYPDSIEPEPPASRAEVRAFARRIHEAYFAIWNDVTGRIRTIVEPHFELYDAIANLIVETNSIFAGPYKEIRWKVEK